MSRHHEVLAALEDLELAAQRPRRPAQVRGGHDNEDDLARSSDAHGQWAQPAHATADPEIERERAAHNERPEESSETRKRDEPPDAHDSDVPRMTRLLGAVGLGYALGTVPSADIAARLTSGGRVDLRRQGSRNPGAVNAARLLGANVGRAVTVADVAKGYAAAAAGRALAGDLGAHVGATSAVIGHCYPAWSGFSGGKGVATSFGQCLYTFPVAAPLDLALALGTARIPGLRRPGVVSTAVATSAWLLLSVVWWRRRLKNSWGPEPSRALVVSNAVTACVIATRFAAAHRRGHPDELG